MKTIKQGGHRLFEKDAETAATVSAMLVELEKHGMDAVRSYSRKFDAWDPPDFEMREAEIRKAISSLPRQVIEDTEFCQDNVRRFAEAQRATMTDLEVELRPGVLLGHRHIPVNSAGSYVPGGRYPMFGSAQMSIIPAKVAGVKTVLACTPPVKGSGFYPATVNAMSAAGADRIFILGGVPAFAPLTRQRALDLSS
jgi:sulfopropanediol 3-dehydrogenase